MSIARTTDPADIIYAPQEASRIEVQHLESKRTNRHLAVPFGLPTIDRVMTPGTAGDLIGILGRPGAGKTMVMNAWARQRAKFLASSGLSDSQKRVVVYCSLEQPIEELAAFHTSAETSINSENMKRGTLTDEQWEEVIGVATAKIRLPLWFIGHSLERRKKRPRLTVEFLFEALVFMEDEYGITLDCVFLDYLQRVPFSGRVESKIVGTTDVLNECKDGAIATGCPWVVGIQAGRQVDKYEPPVPNMDDGQWTSGVEQIVDSLHSVVRPCKYKREGELFGKKEPVIVQGENQLLFSIIKQKTGRANVPIWVLLDPRYNRLADAELRNALPDDDDFIDEE